MKFEILVCFAFLIIAVTSQEESPGIVQTNPEPSIGSGPIPPSGPIASIENGFVPPSSALPSVEPAESGPQICKPSEVRKVECNICKCSKGGTKEACTRKACPKPAPTPSLNTDDQREKRDVSNVNKKCEPNTTYKKDCRTCRCSPQGIEACTLQKCPPKTKRDTETREKVCVPKASFKKDCNTCICSDDGFRAQCTQIGCNAQIPMKN